MAHTVDEMIKTALSMLPEVLHGAKVDAIGLQGGIGRGYVDELSDIDMVLAFENMDQAAAAAKGELVIQGHKVSVFQVCYSKVNPKHWQDKQRYLYAFETRIISDPQGRLQQLCRDAMLSPDEQTARLVYMIKKLGNRGITYKGILNDSWRHMYWNDRADLWVQRGDLFAAHIRINQSIELLINLLFTLNGQPVPSSKGKHHLVFTLPWTPPDFQSQLGELVILHAFTAEEFNRRCHLCIDLVTTCIDQADKSGLLPENINDFYYSRYSSHMDNTEE